jgi:DNA-binding PadR family transcriptional regulator
MVINVRQRASLYQMIERLQRAGLIVVRETSRAEKWPERKVYELTDKGRAAALVWLRDMLATPAHEFPEFPAAIAHLPLLAPDDAQVQLEARAAALAAEIARIDAQLANAGQVIPRLFLLESEYLRAVMQAELAWVRAIVEELRSGQVTWNEEWLRAVAARLTPENDPARR